MNLQDVKDYRDSLQQLYDLLDQLFWDPATPGPAKDAIYAINTELSSILTVLNQALVAADTTQLTTLQSSVDEVNAEIRKAQAQVNTWIKDIGIAAQVAGLMDKALALALKVFGVPS